MNFNRIVSDIMSEDPPCEAAFELISSDLTSIGNFACVSFSVRVSVCV